MYEVKQTEQYSTSLTILTEYENAAQWKKVTEQFTRRHIYAVLYIHTHIDTYTERQSAHTHAYVCMLEC